MSDPRTSETGPGKPSREEYRRGLPGYHDPLARYGGAAPTLSPLTLRAVIAGVMLLVLGAAIGFAFQLGYPGFGIAFAVLAAIALVDLVWVLLRKRRGEPG